MPRNLHIKPPFRPSRIPAILRSEVRKPSETIVPYTPRLWNAKRRIKTSQGLSRGKYFEYRRDPRSTDWRSHVSPDVAAFIDRNPNLLPEEKGDLLRGPSKYFSRPHHVPLDQRKQIYLPRFSIMLIRTPRLGPHYAHFQVPLWFNKLDMKSYLKNVYDVDIVHVRSSVTWGKKDHRQAYRPGGTGDAFRHASKKRMTVQLAEPFEWPEEVKNFEEYVSPSRSHPYPNIF
jgi:Ribosomal protein L23